MLTRALAVAVALAFGQAHAGSPIAVAEALVRGKYQGWTYGGSAARKQVDCVQFLVAVCEGTARRKLTRAERNLVLVRIAELDRLTGKAKTAKLAELIVAEDPRTLGVVHALEQMKAGKRVPLDKAARGDFLQYWIHGKSGWFGHAGIIDGVKGNRITLLGAHASPRPNGTIGIAPYKLRLEHGERRKMYVARWLRRR